MVAPAAFTAFSGSGGRPTEAERRLVEATRHGASAECPDLSEAMRVVSADLVAALATGEFRSPDWPDWQIGAGGIQLAGARISGRLALNRRHVGGDLLFLSCQFDEGINLDDARIEGGLMLTGCVIQGGCSMNRAIIRGHVQAYSAQFRNPGRICLSAEKLESSDWNISTALFDGAIMLQQAQIDGPIDADGIVVDGAERHAVHGKGMRCAGWTLEGARLHGQFSLNEATIQGALEAANARFLNPGRLALFAAEAVTGPWYLDEAKFEGLVSLRGAHLGAFVAPGATFENGAQDAVQAERVRSGKWILLNATVNGTFSLNDATIGHFKANGASFSKPGEIALWAQDVRASSWTMYDAVVRGGFNFAGAVIDAQFLADGATFENSGGVAIWAQRARADGWHFPQAKLLGSCDLNGIEVATSFGAMEATFSNPGGVALRAATARIGSWWMNRARIEGDVDVNGARFESDFNGAGVTIEQTQCAALNGRSAEFRGGIQLCDGASLTGELDLTGATIGQQLDLSEATFIGGHHRAIRLQEARVTGEVSLRQSRLFGHLDASRMRVEGRIDLKGARFVAASLARSRGALPATLAPAANTIDIERQDRYRHHAIVLQEARIDGRLVMPDSCPEGIVDLSRAQCDTLEDDHRGWPAPLPRNASVCDERLCLPGADAEAMEIQHLVLDGFEYRYLEFPAGRPGEAADIARARSDWLAGQSVTELKTHFNPQPWLHAASVLRTMGHDEEAQELAIARRVRQRLAHSTPRFRRLVSWLLHLVSDYGFNPWKTVRISAVCIVLFALAYWALVQACGGFGVWSSQPGACGDAPVLLAVRYGDVHPVFAGQAYPRFEPVTYSLDTFVPFFDLGSEGYWRANTRAYAGPWPVGWALYVLVVIERFLGGILLAIAITGFTGLLTRDER